MTSGCPFCAIISGSKPAAIALDEPEIIGFLDDRPVFPGHTLLVPKMHVAHLQDLPDHLGALLWGAARRVAAALHIAVEAEGTFVALNDRVSQSVPHLHVHAVPRRKGDGLRGFFWPRTSYEGPEHVERVRGAIAAALRE